MTPRVLVHLHVEISEAALFVGQRAVNQLFELFDAERFKSKDLGPRDERAVYVKERIVSGGAYQPNVSGLNVGQEDVLLRLIEMMDLVNEEDGLLSGCVAAIRRASNYATHFGHVTFHAADSNEFGVRHFCDDAGQRGLSAPWRAGEDHRRQTIGFNGASQKFAGAKDVFLADKFLQRARSHPCGERRSAVCGFNLFLLLE